MTVFMENLDLPKDLAKLDKVHEELAAQEDIIHSVDSWYLDFKKYMNTNFLTGVGMYIVQCYIFSIYLVQFGILKVI